jgi:hypothetical protein
MLTVKSRNGVPVRLTDERWEHIITGHSELSDFKEKILDAIAEPELIFEGRNREYLAVKNFNDNKKIVVIYSEFIENNGFVITAYITSKVEKLTKLKRIWPL